MLKPWKSAAHALFSIISFNPRLHGRETRAAVAGKWPAAQELFKRAGNFVSTPPHPSPEHLFQTTRLLITDELFLEVSAKVSQQPHTAISKCMMLIWNKKDNVKYGDFPDQSQSFWFLLALSHCHCCKLREEPKQTTSLLNRSGRELSRVWTIYMSCLRLCVLWKPYLYKWFLSRLIRGTQREYSSKPLKHSIVKRILVFKL